MPASYLLATKGSGYDLIPDLLSDLFASLLRDHTGRLDHNVRLRHIGHRAARGGRRALDLLHYVHARDHLAEHGITVAVAVGVVEAGVIDSIDEELRCCRIRIARARHGERAGRVLQPVLAFKRNGRARGLFSEARRVAAA